MLEEVPVKYVGTYGSKKEIYSVQSAFNLCQNIFKKNDVVVTSNSLANHHNTEDKKIEERQSVLRLNYLHNNSFDCPAALELLFPVEIYKSIGRQEMELIILDERARARGGGVDLLKIY